jgi:hypothetical protein
VIRYEDLLTAPDEQAARVLCHLGIERTANEIAAAVENQSFKRKKEMLLQKGETGQAKFLRVGKSGQWREKLPRRLQARFVHELGADLAAWNYLR